MKIKYLELNSSFHFSNEFDPLSEGRFVYDKTTGEIIYADDEEEYHSNDFIYLPQESDFDSNYWTIKFIKTLDFDIFEELYNLFRNRGKFRRLKDRLHELELLDDYHEFISTKEKEFLLAWCSEHNIEVD